MAIAALEQFIQSCQNEFDSWNAAYRLGKTFDPGNKIAIATKVIGFLNEYFVDGSQEQNSQLYLGLTHSLRK